MNKMSNICYISNVSIQSYLLLCHSSVESFVFFTQMKLASMKLAKLYMKRVSMEIESVKLPEKESMQEALLLQSVRFAYRAHQVI